MKGRLKGFIFIFGGAVIGVFGFGIWQDPEIDWQSLVNSWSLAGEEFVRLKEAPLAILGILILVLGAFVIYHGIKRLLRG